MHILTPKPTRLHHDHETFSEVDLRKTGVSIYSRDPSTEILMTAYALDDGPVEQWVPAEGEDMPAQLEDSLLDPDIKKYAWNAQFERYLWKYCYGMDIPIEQWRDPMVMAYAASFPGKLLKCGEVLKLPEEYMKKDGHRLINWFSKMRPATKTMPVRRVHWHEKYALWKEYKEYNVWDVKAERKIYRILRKYDIPSWEWDLWHLDQEINERGIPVNMDMCNNIIEARDELVAERLERMKEISGLANPNANGQLLGWLQENGYVFDDLKAGHIKRAKEMVEEQVQDDLGHTWAEHQDLHEMLDLRSEVSRTSTKKFDAVASHTDKDGRLRNCFQFCAAGRTWRWGGRVFQPQNLAKPVRGLDGLTWEKLDSGFEAVTGGTQIDAAKYLETLNAEGVEMIFARPMDAMSGAVRTVVQAPPGYVFIDADLSAIENVVLGFMSGDERILGVFKRGADPYVDFATYLYDRPYTELFAEYKAGDKAKRTVAKPGVLGCGYMLGAGKQFENHKTGEIEATGLLGYAWNMGVPLTPEESEMSVRVWRETFKDAVSFWYDLQRAAFKCMNTKKRVVCGPVCFEITGSFLSMRLPSGRSLRYYKPRIEDVMAPWGEMKPTLTYMGLNDKNQWVRISTHPGKLTENGDQAIARDLLAHGIVNANREGIPIVMHIHDQIVGLVREEEAEEKLKLLVDCMTDLPKWAGDMPVKAAGHISKWFVKD